MTRQSTKFKGLRAARLLLYQFPSGVKSVEIAEMLGVYRTTAWRWLKEMGALYIEAEDKWVLRPTQEEIEYAQAVLLAAGE